MADKGWIHKYAFENDALAADATGRQAVADGFLTIAKLEAALLAELIVIGPVLQAEVLALTVYFNHKVTVNKIRSFLTVVIAGADSVITAKNNAGSAMANGVLTIAVAGVAVGDEDSVSPTTNNVIDVDQKLTLALDGGPSAGEAIFFIECTRTA